MKNWMFNNWFKILAIAILLGSIGTHPYAYYQILRWIVCATAAYLAYSYIQAERTAFFWLFTATAILFNPVAPIYMSRSSWQIFDLLAALLLAVSLFATTAKKEEK